MNGNGRAFISSTGAFIAAICFFLPWVGCQGQNASGADMGKDLPALWIVFIAAVVIIAVIFYFNKELQLNKARPIVSISSLIAIAIMVYYYFDMTRSEFARFFEIKFGSIGTLIGFVLALIGTLFLTQERTSVSSSSASRVNEKIKLSEYEKPDAAVGWKAYDAKTRKYIGRLAAVDVDAGTCTVKGDFGDIATKEFEVILVQAG